MPIFKPPKTAPTRAFDNGGRARFGLLEYSARKLGNKRTRWTLRRRRYGIPNIFNTT